MKIEKNYVVFPIHKIQQILKRFVERKPLIFEECNSITSGDSPQNYFGLKASTVFAVYLFGFRELPVRQKYWANKILNYILSLLLHAPIVFSILITLLYIIYIQVPILYMIYFRFPSSQIDILVFHCPLLIVP